MEGDQYIQVRVGTCCGIGLTYPFNMDQGDFFFPNPGGRFIVDVIALELSLLF